MSIACSTEKVCAGFVSMPPAMKWSNERIASSSSLRVRSHALKLIASSSAARGCSHGAAGSSSAASASSAAMRVFIAATVSDAVGKSSPSNSVRRPSGAR